VAGKCAFITAKEKDVTRQQKKKKKAQRVDIAAVGQIGEKVAAMEQGRSISCHTEKKGKSLCHRIGSQRMSRCNKPLKGRGRHLKKGRQRVSTYRRGGISHAKERKLNPLENPRHKRKNIGVSTLGKIGARAKKRANQEPSTQKERFLSSEKPHLAEKGGKRCENKSQGPHKESFR